MQTVCTLWENEATVHSLIENEILHPEQNYFVQIMTADLGPEHAVQLAREIQAFFPAAQIIGASASGVIYEGEQYEKATLVLFRQFEQTQVFTAPFVWRNKTAAEVACEVADSIAEMPVRLMHVLCGGHYYDVHNFVEEFNKRNNKTAMVGGIAGDIIPENIPGFVFTPTGVVEDGLLVAALYGGNYSYYNGVNISHEPISGKHVLTGSEGGQWKTINNIEIREWLFEQLGIEGLKEYSDWEDITTNDVMVRFPMILENYHGASRFLRYDKEIDGITQYFSQIPEGTAFRIGYVNPSECVKESFRLCNEVMDEPIEELFCYTCLFRRLYLHNCAEWELKPYRNAHLCGAFMMGEISNIEGYNEFFNGACCLVGLAENEVYIRPDMQGYEELNGIEDDTKDLLNIALKRQQEATTRYNEQLMDTLLRQQANQREQLYIDFNTGLFNYLKYKEERKTRHFDKVCIIKIENAELLLTHLGHSAYQSITSNAAKQIQDFLHGNYPHEGEMLSLYAFNDSSLFLAAEEHLSPENFLRVCSALFEKYHFIQTSDEGEVLVNRYAVALGQKDLIESALNSLVASKNTQTPFLVCQQEEESGVSSGDEFRMIGILNWALENDGVVPYYQGIYDNYAGKITKYEALMRIVDRDGRVYPPAQFMGIAKKYHMYASISRRMIEKVFARFAHRREVIELNLSVFDVLSDEMTDMIFERLRSCDEPTRFILEILEDEEYRDFAPLKQFIESVKKLGARVAIDDFGAGYSNLFEVTSINFDIIKVDGSIIRNLAHNECNRKLLEVITHMGRLFEADIVAEFVENAHIQALVEQASIRYSQGYHFAKPAPFEELGLLP